MRPEDREEETGIKVVGNLWVAFKNGREIARMFFDNQSQRYEIWSIFENERIRQYKTLTGGLKALSSYIDED